MTDWMVAREMSTLNDFDSETCPKSTLTEYKLFLLRASNVVQNNLLDFMVFTDPETLPPGIRHHPSMSHKELKQRQNETQSKFINLWSNQGRTDQEVDELIIEQFEASKQLFLELELYHLQELKKV